MLTPSVVNIMSNDDRCFVYGKWVIWVATTLTQSVIAVMNLANLCWTAPTRFLHQKHYTTKTGLIQGNDTPTPKGTGHTQTTVGTDMGDISTDHNHAAIQTITGAAAVSEGTHHSPYPGTAAAHVILWMMDAPIATHTITHPTGIVTPHPILTTSSAEVTHATIP